MNNLKLEGHQMAWVPTEQILRIHLGTTWQSAVMTYEMVNPFKNWVGLGCNKKGYNFARVWLDITGIHGCQAKV